ncbi:MAG: transglutaminase-like putative cysteine protease [Paraglaciecola sp.]|jgi:transglutaminase-like putative cysteine protease
MPQYAITHHTAYHFDEPLAGVNLLACLQPVNSASQILEFHKVICIPIPIKRSQKKDAFGNTQEQLSFQRTLQKVEVTSVSTVIVKGKRSQLHNSGGAPSWRELFEPGELEVILTQALAYCEALFSASMPLPERLSQLMAKLYREFVYDVTATTVATPISDLLRFKRGVCQDFARVMIAVLQANGIDARYVSGYLFCGPLENNTTRQAASHAWVSVFMPDEGWVDLDPTNNKWVDEDYITLAWGRDYVDVVPVKGMLNEDRQQRIKVLVTIEKQQD